MQGTALVFLALAAFVIFQALRLNYYTRLGPGPGFFPFWLGTTLALLSLAWLLQVSLRSLEAVEEGFVPDRGGLARIVAILAALALFAGCIELLGFRLTMFAFMAFLLLALSRTNLLLAAPICLLGSFGVYHAFVHWLDVPLPTAGLDVLRQFGL